MKILLPNSVNIFCDASMHKENGITHGCPGAVTVTVDSNGNQNIIDVRTELYSNTTNNHSEINAILLGVKTATKYIGQCSYLNLFSDSQISIRGLREWIFGWINNKMDGKMYSSSGSLVANQECFLKVIRVIIENRMVINLYHQNGHTNLNKSSDIEKAKKVFKESNNILLDDDDVIGISEYNNYIDNTTRNFLKANLHMCLDVLREPIYYDPTRQDIYFTYKNLIKRR